MRTRRAVALAVIGLFGASALTVGPVAPVRAAEYSLETTATYTVRPAEGEVAVHVALDFTNTTPDPEGQFSIFDELRVAVHDGVTSVDASDTDGDLEASVEVTDGVNIATVELREGLRYEESADVELDYVLADGASPRVRIGPSLVVFPAWGFGTASEVRIDIPAGFEIRVDGDTLREVDGTLTSGPIEDPSAWLALVTAIGPADYRAFEATIPLSGGTADLLVRALADDPEWGAATRDLLVEALPLIEREIGLPYPLLGQLVVTQSVPADSSDFGEAVSRRSEVQVAYDQPPFTVLHQVAHVWLPPTLVDARWIVEGLASDVAARVGDTLDIEPPYNPADAAADAADAALPLDAWTASSSSAQNAFAYPASWALMAEIRAAVGDDALRTVFARVAGSVGPYDGAVVEPPVVNGDAPAVPLTTRSFLDQLETVGATDLSEAFARSALTDADVALLPARSAARDAFAELVTAADGWGAPDPVRASMSAWRFDDAAGQIEAARAWISDRDDLLAAMERAGLSNPDRLAQAYRAYGGGPEAVTELEAQRAVVDAYAAAAERINAPRSFMARLGLLGGSDPSVQLALANGRFADGNLTGSMDAIGEALRQLDAAETGGLVRLVSLVLLVVVLAALAVALFRRRASYTAAP